MEEIVSHVLIGCLFLLGVFHLIGTVYLLPFLFRKDKKVGIIEFMADKAAFETVAITISGVIWGISIFIAGLALLYCLGWFVNLFIN